MSTNACSFDRDGHRWIAGSVQQFAVPVDVVARLDTAPDAPHEYVVSHQHRQCWIATELVAQRGRGYLALTQRCPITHVSWRVWFVLGDSQLVQIAQHAHDLLLSSARPFGRGGVCRSPYARVPRLPSTSRDG